MTPGLGHIPDDPDDRDLSFALLGDGEPPDEWAAEVDTFVRRNQRQTNSCTGFASTTAIHSWLSAHGIEAEIPSALAAYINARLVRDGLAGTKRDEGANLRSLFRALNRYGFCPDSLWPFESAKVNKRPPFSAYLEQYKRRKARYRRLYGFDATLIRKVKQAMANGSRLVFGLPVTQKFVDHSGPGVLPPPSGNEKYLGGHALATGDRYDADACEIFNSWGKGWGDGGRGMVSWEFLVLAVDWWAVDVIG